MATLPVVDVGAISVPVEIKKPVPLATFVAVNDAGITTKVQATTTDDEVAAAAVVMIIVFGEPGKRA